MKRKKAKQDGVEPGSIQAWAEKVNWRRRVKAVCKPCWELKYCPYGPLVEYFPLRRERDERSCRIFGHDCPVFFVAEPLTETKELRNITRRIPRGVQFRVLKRENQICRRCGQPVKDDEVHFDHVIPWAKGGPSDEHNVQLLCRKCNLKKGKSFEEDHLVSSLSDHLAEPVGPDILAFLSMAVAFSHGFRNSVGRSPTAQDFADEFAAGEATGFEEMAAEMVQDLDEIFRLRSCDGMSRAAFRALRYRWGYKDGEVRKLRFAAKSFDLDPLDLLAAEVELVRRLGWRVRTNSKDAARWLRL